ncbi:hypothetical protein BX666DRAFT_1920028 [Dichotomocladium elegans]|nr:hypothetical protein BX666DRAFT_1920028 [Dichotomocladium elegans]
MTFIEESRSPSIVRRMSYRPAKSLDEGNSAEKTYPVVVAIDFGTTFSGCSYKYAHDEQVYDIVKWPKHSSFYAKVPTLLYYRGRANRLVGWGEGARRLSLQPGVDGTLIRQFKLWLAYREDDSQSSIPPLLDNQTAVDAIADYLRCFHEYVYEEMQRTGAAQYSQEQFRYCLTVPAIWDDHGKATMREAMVQAGIIDVSDPPERLVLVTEPEAAAMYCEKQCGNWNMQDQDSFMIVDAGGGTVDLIVYRMEMKNEKRLHEITRGCGGTCGSAYIDNNMRRLVLEKIGLEEDQISSCAFENVMDVFTDKIKPYYCGEGDQRLQLPAMIMAQLNDRDPLVDSDGCILISADELNDKVYNPVFKQVLQLIEDQLTLANTFVNSLFLVGGFGCSEYLYKTVEEHFRSRIPNISMAPRGDIAVARGAIYHITNPEFISTRVLRCTYGLHTRKLFEEGLDPEESAIVTDDGVKRCATRFDVVAAKGQQVQANTKISREFWVRYPRNTDADIYIYYGDGPIPRQITDPGVQRVIEFPITMPYLEGYKPGDRVDMKIDFIFGLAELKVHVFIAGRQMEFVSTLNE